MESPKITVKEFKVISQLGKDINITQRRIPQKVQLSLGLINIILTKLIKNRIHHSRRWRTGRPRRNKPWEFRRISLLGVHSNVWKMITHA